MIRRKLFRTWPNPAGSPPDGWTAWRSVYAPDYYCLIVEAIAGGTRQGFPWVVGSEPLNTHIPSRLDAAGAVSDMDVPGLRLDVDCVDYH